MSPAQGSEQEQEQEQEKVFRRKVSPAENGGDDCGIWK